MSTNNQFLWLDTVVSGDNIRRDTIKTLILRALPDANVIVEVSFTEQAKWYQQFAKIAKPLYLALTTHTVLSTKADLDNAFLKQAFASLGSKPAMKIRQATPFLSFAEGASQWSDTYAQLFSAPELPELMAKAANLPQHPGVYIFYNQSHSPIYVGKSVNIRQRVMSHFSARFRDAKEFKLFKQTSRIECLSRNGALGALLLESQWVKKLKPIYNVRLRKTQNNYALCHNDRNPYGQLTVEVVNDRLNPNYYGWFRNTKQAHEAIDALVKKYNLCGHYTPIPKASRPCFRFQIGQCLGACLGLEPPKTYNERLLTALQRYQQHQWAFGGPIAVVEEGIHSPVCFHVFHQWRYFGSALCLSRARALLKQPNKLTNTDLDAVRYLKQSLQQASRENIIAL